MLQALKQSYREIRLGESGTRFRAHYHHRHSDTVEPHWQRYTWIVGGLLVAAIGLLLSIPPVIPGFLLWLPALAVVSARLYWVAWLLDTLERLVLRWRRPLLLLLALSIASIAAVVLRAS